MTSVKKNFIYNLAYQILTFLTPLITTPYLSRVLGAEKTGVYSFSYSIAYYFVLFAMLGLNNYGNREIAKVREDIELRSKTFWSIYGLQFITAILALIAYTIYSIYTGGNVINYIMALYVASSLFDINWFFWGMEEFKITVTRNTLIKLGTVVGILLFVKSQDDLYAYSLIMVGGMLLSALILWPYLRKRVKFYRPKLNEITQHLRPNMLLFIPVIAVSLYKVMDKIMLGNMASYAEVGFYDYSEKIIAIPICVVNALGTVMLPRMSNLVAKQDNEVENYMIHKSIIFGTIMSCAMSFGLMAVANVFVPLFYGEGYLKCISLFYILLPSCVFLAIANVIRTQYLIPHSMDKQYTFSLILGAVVNLIVNATLIPRMQSIGAAVGTLIAEMFVCVFQILCVKKFLPIKQYLSDIIYIAFAGLVMAIIVFCLPVIGGNATTLAFKVLSGAFVFLIIVLIKYRNLVRELTRKKG